jgi:hypothetical protein
LIYLSGADNVSWRKHAMTDPIGICATPDIGTSHAKALACYRFWAADNACFAHPNDFSLEVFLSWLAGLEAVRETCLFATAPDVVADWPATLARSLPAIPLLRAAGHRAAIVLQDGATPEAIPDCDAVFVGGSTAWKLSLEAWRCVAAAKARGLWAHMGRVNSLRRLRKAAAVGCDSVDGTFIAFGPEINTRRMIRWLRRVNAQGRLCLKTA